MKDRWKEKMNHSIERSDKRKNENTRKELKDNLYIEEDEQYFFAQNPKKYYDKLKNEWKYIQWIMLSLSILSIQTQKEEILDWMLKIQESWELKYHQLIEEWNYEDWIKLCEIMLKIEKNIHKTKQAYKIWSQTDSYNNVYKWDIRIKENYKNHPVNDKQENDIWRVKSLQFDTLISELEKLL